MFTPDEISLIQSIAFFESKNRITANVIASYNHLRTITYAHWGEWINQKIHSVMGSGKISRGENLDGLPWINSDAPGIFKKQDVFALRFLFWWGHHYSITLHLGGNFIRCFKFENLSQLNDENVFWCIALQPWNYHYRSDNYIPLHQVLGKRVLSQKNDFIKVSYKFDLSTLNQFEANNLSAATKLITLIETQDEMASILNSLVK
jgi:hypothetical protein